MWIARDKYRGLHLFLNKPEFKYSTLCWEDNGEKIEIPFEWYPNLKWEDEPEECHISLNNPIYTKECPYCHKTVNYRASDIKTDYQWQPGTDGWEEDYIECPECGKCIHI